MLHYYSVFCKKSYCYSGHILFVTSPSCPHTRNIHSPLSFFSVFHRETWPPHLNSAKIHVTGSHAKKMSQVFPVRHQLNGVSINVFSCSPLRRDGSSFFFFSFPSFSPLVNDKRKAPDFGHDCEYHRFKAITLPHPAEETPTRWLSSLCTVNKYNAKRDYWTVRTAFCVFFSSLLFTALFFVFCFFATHIKILAGDVWWLLGNGS